METLIGLAILVYSAILHEIAHGFVADRLGDPTARLMKRLTLDPRPHIDPFMSIALPLLLYISSHGAFVFGAAKPVPIDPFNLKEGRKDVALVALSGPLTNILLAIVAAIIYRFLDWVPILFPAFVGDILGIAVFYNLLLAVFNLIPIPPLDGSKIFALILPEKEANAYLSFGNIGMFILLFLLFFPIGAFSLGDLIFHKILPFAQSLLLP